MRLLYISFAVIFLPYSLYALSIFGISLKPKGSILQCIDSTFTSSGMTHVYRIPAGTNSMFLITSDRGMILIDCGWPGFEWRVKKLMNQLHRNDLRLIVITHAHFDHYGSAAAIRRLTGAPVAIHELDEECMAQGVSKLGQTHSWGTVMKNLLPIGQFFIPVENTFADILFDDHFNLKPYGINGYVLHTPGHTPGSVSVIINDEIAFAGDLLSTSGIKIQSQQYFSYDWYLQAHSLILLKSKAPLRTYPSHGNRFIKTKDLFELQPLIVE